MEEMFQSGGESVYLRGDSIPTRGRVNFIKSGSVALYSAEDAKRKHLFTYKAGEIFPYITPGRALPSGRQLEYRPLSTASLLWLPRKRFETEAYKPENIKRFVHSLMEIMELQIERIDNLEQKQVYNRLLSRLNFFARRLGVQHGDKIIIDAPLSHGDLASSIGTSRETVNRLMKKLESEGVVTVKNQTVIINSPEKLRNMAPKKRAASKTGSHKLLMLAGLATLVADAAATNLPQ